ncbi:hypothetical protein JCM8547_008830 [Rhodosporidiobolus lusitaniae]
MSDAPSNATATSPERVRSLVAKHEGAIKAASPSTSPVLARRSLSSTTLDAAAAPPTAEPTSPSPKTKDLPSDQDLLAPPPPAASNGEGSSNGTSLSGSTVLGDIQEDAGSAEEGEADAQNGESEAAKEGGEVKEDGEQEKKDEETKKPGSDSPLAAIAATLPELAEKERERIQANLERAGRYPRELPLSASWTLHFSDTSGASKSSSAAVTKDAYTEGINPIFTATTVPSLCGSLKAFKKAARRKNAKPTDPDGMGLYRAGMNLHFFRTGISPTWEDPYNEKGGRITISPSAHAFDSVYERLILLLAGASLEIQAAELLLSEGPSPNGKPRPANAGPPQVGLINGVVASRRARGDRIELWLGGAQKKEPAPPEWLERLREVLAVELEDPALRTAKYKKHF